MADRLQRRVSQLEQAIAGCRSISSSEFRAVNTELAGLRQELRAASARQDARDRELSELEQSLDRLRTDLRERFRLLEQQVQEARQAHRAPPPTAAAEPPGKPATPLQELLEELARDRDNR